MLLGDPGSKQSVLEALAVKPLETSYVQTMSGHGIDVSSTSSTTYAGIMESLSTSFNENYRIKPDEGLSSFDDIKTHPKLETLLLSAKNGNSMLGFNSSIAFSILNTF